MTSQAQTPQTLAQQVRAKYPGVYDDLSDQALEAAVLKKYPGIYDDIPKTGAAATVAPTSRPQDDGNRFVNFGKGVIKGVVDTADSALGGLAAMFPGMNYREADRARVHHATRPHGSAQQAGYVTEKVVETAVPVGSAVRGAVKAIPSTARASKTFQEVMAAARNVPVDVSKPGNVALRIMQLSERGGTMPKVVRDFLRRVTDPEKTPLAYEEARDFASNISRLSADEFKRLTPVMAREVGNLRSALNTAVGNATKTVAKDKQYYQAMSEYSRAIRMGQTIEKAKDVLLKYAIPTGVIGGGIAAYQKVFGGK